jgi:hypothetical protein
LRAKCLRKGWIAPGKPNPAVVKTYSLGRSRRTLHSARFLRQMIRKEDGKEHRYFSVVENKRVAGGRVVQRHVLYLGEINEPQELAWRKSIEVFDEGGRPWKAPSTSSRLPCKSIGQLSHARELPESPNAYHEVLPESDHFKPATRINSSVQISYARPLR